MHFSKNNFVEHMYFAKKIEGISFKAKVCGFPPILQKDILQGM
jgi:hypothetical protein